MRFYRNLVFRNLHEIPLLNVKKTGIRKKSGFNIFPDFPVISDLCKGCFDYKDLGYLKCFAFCLHSGSNLSKYKTDSLVPFLILTITNNP